MNNSVFDIEKSYRNLDLCAEQNHKGELMQARHRDIFMCNNKRRDKACRVKSLSQR